MRGRMLRGDRYFLDEAVRDRERLVWTIDVRPA